MIVLSVAYPRLYSHRRGVAAAFLLLSLLCLLRSGRLRAQSEQSTAAPPRDLSSKANAARDANQLDQAVILYEKALGLRPSWTAGWWSLGTIQYDQNSYAEAAESFRKVVALAPKAGTAWAMLGLCEFELGSDDSALKHLERGQSLGVANDPQLLHVMLYHEGVLLRRIGQFENAKTAFDRLCADGVQNDHVAQYLGMAALRMRAMNPPTSGTEVGVVILLTGRAECLAAQNKFDEARQGFQAIVEDHPDFPGIHYAYGKFFLQLHDISDATREFESEIKNNPREVMARLEIAAIKYRVDSAAGLPYAREAVKLNPQLPFGHYLLGLLLLDTRHYQEALRELRIARQAFSSVPNVYFALGTAYSRLGRKQEAAQAWATFNRLNQKAGKSGPLYYGQESLDAQGRLGP